MRIGAAILALALCTFIGYMKADKVKERMRTIDSFLRDIRQISMQIEFTSDPISIIIDKISKDSELAELWQEFLRHLNDGMSCSMAWTAASKSREDLIAVLANEERIGLDEFFSTLGRLDKASEKKNAEHIYKLLEDISSRLKKTHRTV